MNAVGWVEARRSPRFTLRLPLEASFGAADAQVMNISATGALVEEGERPAALEIRELAFESPVTRQRHAFRARVIWSRLERSHGPGRLVYQAGLEFLEHQQDAVELIEELVSVRLAFPKTSLFDSATPGQQEQLLRVERASDYFSEHPDEVAKWADYAIAAKVAPRTAPRDLVFAIWEYLDRVVDLELVKKFLFERARQQQ